MVWAGEGAHRHIQETLIVPQSQVYMYAYMVLRMFLNLVINHVAGHSRQDG